MIDIDAMMKDSREIVGEQNQLEAVKENGFAIQHIYTPSESVQLEAVKENGFAIQFFKKAWRKNTAKKMTVSEIETLLGYKVEVVSE